MRMSALSYAFQAETGTTKWTLQGNTSRYKISNRIILQGGNKWEGTKRESNKI